MTRIAIIRFFLAGAIFSGCLAIGLFFLRFWMRDRDRLFALFAAAFWVFALERVLVVVISASEDHLPYVYLLRLVGFALILVGIVDKNVRK